MSSSIVGAWQLVSDTREGFMVFTDQRFNIYAGVEDQRLVQNAASEEALTARTVHGSGGTYQSDGSTAMLHYRVTAVPGYADREVEIAFDLEGAELTIRGTQPDGTQDARSTWLKVG